MSVGPKIGCLEAEESSLRALPCGQAKRVIGLKLIEIHSKEGKLAKNFSSGLLAKAAVLENKTDRWFRKQLNS